jgi:nitrate/nitrite-specific signal transduction histidine kinase
MRSLKFRLPSLSLRGAITLAFIIISTWVLALAIASFIQLRQVQPYSDDIVATSADMVSLQRIGTASAALDADMERYLTIRGVEYQEAILADVKEMQEALMLLKSGTHGAKHTEITALGETLGQVQQEVQNVLDSIASNASSGDINRRIVTVYNDLDQTKSLQETLLATTLNELQGAAAAQGRIANTVQRQALILGLVVLFTAVIATIAVNLRLRGITVLTQVTTAIAGGDLTRVAPEGRRDEIGTLAVSFNAMTRQLREMVTTLEQRVTDRTRAIETSAEISRRLSTILDQKQLALAVVEEVQRAFNYYHAHIYLYDESGENLVMVGGTGEAGQLMLGRGHQIPRDRGLVGRAAETNQVVLVSDTQADPSWLPNPLLPDTKAEVAVPISSGGRVSGVLDVQHNVVNGLGQQDVDMLQSIANQVGVAVQNAALFTQTQRLADREALVNAIGQKIQTASSVEGVLQVLARELGAALKVQRVLVQVGSSPADQNTGKG